MANKIIEKIIEPSKIMVGSTFLIKIKVDMIESYRLITERGENIITEQGENLLTEGDFYNGQESE